MAESVRRQTMGERLEALLPHEACRELVEALEGYARRAHAGRTVPDSILVGIILSHRTGEVMAIDLPRRVGR